MATFDVDTLAELQSLTNIVVAGTSGDDTLEGTDAADTLDGLQGSDDLFGFGGDDTLNGGGGDDTLDGGAGNDTMTGGGGDDRYFVDSPDDTVIEGVDRGFDTVRSSASAYTLEDNVEKLVLIGDGTQGVPVDTPLGTLVVTVGAGNELDNRIKGDEFDNLLDGGDGNDKLIGRGGFDILSGGAGDDRLIGVDKNTLSPGSGEIDIFVGGTGADEFSLGNSTTAYYTDDAIVNGQLVPDGALIVDFSIADGDVIILNGSADDYALQDVNQGNLSGTVIVNTTLDNEIIGLVAGVTTAQLDLNSASFEFAA